MYLRLFIEDLPRSQEYASAVGGLSDVALSSHKRHIKLFSNQVMDCWSATKHFESLVLLDVSCFSARSQIEIIHNLGRSDSEIGFALKTGCLFI